MPSISQTKSKILVYGLEDESKERQRLDELAANLGIETVTIQKGNENQTLGYLAGLGGFDKNDDENTMEAFAHSIIWFVSVKKEDLSSILQDYSTTEGIKPIDLKAVLTEHNINWKISDHYEELKREHKMMNAYTFLFHAQKTLDGLKPEEYEENSFATFKTAVENSISDYQQIQKGVEVDQDILDDHVQTIRNAYKHLLPIV